LLTENKKAQIYEPKKERNIDKNIAAEIKVQCIKIA